MAIKSISVSLVSFLALLPLECMAAPLTASETFVNRKVDALNGSLHLHGYKTHGDFCLGNGNAIEFGSYQAAIAIDGLGDGMYACKGEFVNVPQKTQVIIFGIVSCIAQDPAALKAACP